MKKAVCLAMVAIAATCLTAVAGAEPELKIIWENTGGLNTGQITLGAQQFASYYASKNGSCMEIAIGDCAELLKGTAAENILQLRKFTFSYDEDPYVTGGFSAINSSGATQTFTFIFTSPVVPALTPSTLYGGSMSGSITAGKTVPATVSTVSGTPLYWGMIDGTPVLPFYPDPQSWTISTAGATMNISARNEPITNPGPAAMNNISMQFKFTLTPDDIATMNGTFVVLIPEPATLSILGLGGLVLLRRRK